MTADEWVAEFCTTEPDDAQKLALDSAQKLEMELLTKENERLKEENAKLREAALRNDPGLR